MKKFISPIVLTFVLFFWLALRPSAIALVVIIVPGPILCSESNFDPIDVPGLEEAGNAAGKTPRLSTLICFFASDALARELIASCSSPGSHLAG